MVLWMSFLLKHSPAPTSTGDRRVLFQCWSWAHKFAVSWNRISIVTGYRFGIRGPFPLPSTYQVMPALGVFLGGVRWGGVTHERNWRKKRPASKSFQISGSGPPMVFGKPHSTRPAFHPGIALHADMVWRKVNLNKA